jgi:eukaryotic-like serine/threonine-protein kinase
MKKGDRVLGYTLVTDGTVSSGRCTWAFAEKAGKKYFIKQFVSPKYPLASTPGSPAGKQEAFKRCKIFEESNQRIANAIRHKVGSGGSIVAPVQFGRVGTTYYKVYERIDVTNFTPAQIAGMRLDQKLLIIGVVAHSVSILHSEKIVHGDMKPPNILIKKSETGAFTAKLIDFDDSYFEGEAPDDPELVIGDPAYYSPELLDYVVAADPTKRSALGTKSDVFAMGIIFSEYWSGRFPEYDTRKFSSCGAAVLAGGSLDLAPLSMPSSLVSIIASMLERDPVRRPTALQVGTRLKDVPGERRTGPAGTKAVGPGETTVSRLRGPLPKERIREGDDAPLKVAITKTAEPSSRLLGKPKV